MVFAIARDRAMRITSLRACAYASSSTRVNALDVAAFASNARVGANANANAQRTTPRRSISSAVMTFGIAFSALIVTERVSVDEAFAERGSLANERGRSKASKALGDAKVTLYQYDVCPFCNKVKAFLDYHDVPYDVVEVNPLTKNEIKFSKDYRKVPIVTIGNEQLNDSSAIMMELTKRIDSNGGNNGLKIQGKTKAYEENERTWLKWVDERFVHVLTPNIYRTWNEAVRSFDYITKRGNFGFIERESARWVGAASMYVIAHRVLKKRHGIVDERADLYLEVNKFINEGVGKQKFCGGNAPNNADIAMFGVLRAVKTFETFQDVMANTACAPWYERMTAAVGAAARTDGVEN